MKDERLQREVDSRTEDSGKISAVRSGISGRGQRREQKRLSPASCRGEKEKSKGILPGHEQRERREFITITSSSSKKEEKVRITGVK